MRNDKSVSKFETFQGMSLVFGRKAEHSKHALYLQFQVWGVKSRGEALIKQMLRGLLPILCVAKTHI